MGRDITIAISAKDNFSDAVTKMRNAGIHFNKSLEEMQAQINAINKNRVIVKMDTKEAQKNLQDIQKEYLAARKSGDGMISDDLIKRLDDANEAYEQARRNLGLLDKAAKETEKSMSGAGGAFSKLESRAGGGAKEGLLGSLAATGVAKMGGDLLAGIAGTLIGSVHGDEGSMMFSSILSNAVSGAEIGTMVGGLGLGTLVGGAAGAGVGFISGSTQKFQKQDEAFKSSRDEMISTQQTRAQNDLQAGIGIASQREMDQIEFSHIMGGKEEAAEYLSWVKDTANATPFLYDDLKSMSKVLATYKFSAEEMQDALIKIGDAGASVGMSSQDMGMVATGLGRMKSSGKTSLEDINLLQERGIDAIGMLEDFHGLDNGEVYEAISKGQLDGGQSTQIILKYLEEYGKTIDEQSKTYSELTSTVQGLEQERQNARGEGYTLERSKGLNDQAVYLQDNLAEMSETERLIGQWEASLDNERDVILREKEAEAYEQIKRDSLTGAEAGRVLAEARIAAEAEYNASEGAQLKLKNELALTENVTAMLARDQRFWDANYRLGKEASKGMMAGIQSYIQENQIRFSANQYALNYEYGGDEDFSTPTPSPNGSSNAYGLSYVPYNNYPARLHEGERVLTASEARAYKSGSGANITITGNEFVIREDADIDRIASELARKLREAQMVS